MTQEVHWKDITFTASATSSVFRMPSSLNLVAIRIPASGTWGADTTITIESAWGTDILQDQTAVADITDWSDCFDNAGGEIEIEANAGSLPRTLHHDVFMVGNFYRLVAGAPKTGTVRVFYKSIN